MSAGPSRRGWRPSLKPTPENGSPASNTAAAMRRGCTSCASLAPSAAFRRQSPKVWSVPSTSERMVWVSLRSRSSRTDSASPSAPAA